MILDKLTEENFYYYFSNEINRADVISFDSTRFKIFVRIHGDKTDFNEFFEEGQRKLELFEFVKLTKGCPYLGVFRACYPKDVSKIVLCHDVLINGNDPILIHDFKKSKLLLSGGTRWKKNM